MSFNHFVDILLHRAAKQSEHLAYSFLANGKDEAGRLTYAALDGRARAIAAHLRRHGSAGDRVLLLQAPGLDFISAFMGCLYAQMIAVPAPPPEGSRLKRTLPRLRAIATDAGASWVIADRKILDLLEENKAGLQVFDRIRKLDLQDGLIDGASWHPEPIDDPNLPAFLQYTSGSTSSPKGVVISHANLMHNSRYINEGGVYTPDMISGTWMPHIHDYGLIDGLLQPLYAGIPCYFMSPMSFLKRPLRWLQAITQYRITHSHGPNFSFDYCVDRIPPEQREGLDLSSWQLASNAAEPVRLETMHRFVEAFGPYGFREETFSPSYGLAEATLMVSTSTFGKKPTHITVEAEALEKNRLVITENQGKGSVSMISVGPPAGEMQLKIVHPETRCLCAPDQVGEIWIADKSVAHGYWNRPEISAEGFEAYLADTGEGPFLRSGDLGFLYEGELYITGRLKDMLIITGRNHYPQDIEATVVASHPDLSPNAAAFAVDRNGSERLHMVVEVVRKAQKNCDIEAIARAASAAVWEHHDLMLEGLVLIKTGSLPKTSSGKVQRAASKAAMLEGSLDELKRWSAQAESQDRQLTPARNERDTLLCGIWCEVLGLEEVGIDDHFLELGGQSLLAIRMISMVRASFGIDLPAESLFLSPTIRQLSELLDQREASADSDAALPTHDPDRTRYPMSHDQRRLWFLDRLEGASAAYHLPVALRLGGILDEAALVHALSRICERHLSTRTRFVEQADEVFQEILPFRELALTRSDLSHLAPADAEREAGKLADAFAAQPFDLTAGNLFRTGLIRLGKADHLLMFNLHHIIGDGWSYSVLARELEALYNGKVRGEDVFLAPLPLQFADYAVWQRERLDRKLLDQQLDWWRARLQDANQVLDLPTVGSRPTALSSRGRTFRFVMSGELTRAIERLARANHATPFIILQAGFAELLGRYGGSRDVCLGTPTANRRFSELESLIGFFANTLVMRNLLDAQDALPERLAKTREMVLGSVSHQDLPFDKLIEVLNPPRELGRSPYFQVMFTFQNAAISDLSLQGLEIESWPIEHGAARFELALTMGKNDGRFEGELEYSTDLFSEAMMMRVAAHFQALMRGFVDYPESLVAQITMLSDEERHLLLETCNQTDVDLSDSPNLVAMFRRQVEQTPDRVAVLFEGETLSYAALDQRSERLAAFLARRGAGPEVAVGVALDRSLDLHIVLLGILKTGSFYVPMDPHTPVDRLDFMIDDASCALLLTRSEHRAELPERDWLVLDQLPEIWETPLVPAFPEIQGHQAVYAFYTSGSTGKPKGVINSHAGVANRIAWGQHFFELKPEDRVIQKTPFTFDLSVWELFWPIVTGSICVVAPPGAHRDPARLADCAETYGVTVFHFVASMMSAFLDNPDACRRISPRLVVNGGEALSPALRDRFFESFPDVAYYNLYGPTEAAMEIMWWRCRPGGPIVPIGTAIGNSRVYVLDRFAQPVPQDVLGELYLAGVQLARCYLNRPALTAQTFIPNPFETRLDQGTRLYKTGDLTRWRNHESGELIVEYLGRIDHQVKLRGLRIELGEIEVALTDMDRIDAAVVLLAEEGSNQRLIAFLFHDESLSEADFELAEIRKFLGQRLPEYMIPASFVFLTEIPTTPNGKINRNALKSVMKKVMRNLGSDDAYVPPANAEEELLCGLWSKVLGLSKVPGVTGNFFDLGGHSLLVTRLVALVRESFSVELSIRDVFLSPTIRDLAARIGEARQSQPDFPAPVVRKRPDRLPLSFAQRRLWFLYRLEGSQPVYNMPACIRLDGPLDYVALERAFNLILARHESLRTHFQEHDSEVVQVIAPPQSVPLIVTECEEDSAGDTVHRQNAWCFDLERGPLFLFHLLRLDANRHMLLVNMHHIISDGWSLSVLIEEMTTLYNGLCQGETPNLAALPLQYADYALWQHEVLDTSLATQLDWWRETLRGAPESLDLPTRGPRPLSQTFHGYTLQFRLDPALTTALNELALSCNATLFQVVQALFAEVLGRHAGAAQVNLGSPVANRRFTVLEPLIGYFANTLVLRNRRDCSQTVRARVAAARDTALGAIAHQDLPFEKLIAVINPTRDQARSPLFQAMLAFQEGSVSDFRLKGVAARLQPVELGTARFEITLLIAREQESLTFSLEYNSDLFSEPMMRRMAAHIEQMARAFVSSPDTRVAHLDMLTEGERAHLLTHSNATEKAFAWPQDVVSAFRQQVARTPEAIAVAFAGETLTYAQLADRAALVAAHLRNLGVTSETPVVAVLERSAWLHAGLLGILGTGGYYVPVAADTPTERLHFILSDAGARVVLTTAVLAGGLSLPEQVNLLALDHLAPLDHTPFSPDIDATNAIYAIFTSGSTGKPKGVINSHGALLNRIGWGQEAFGLDVGDRVLQKTPYTFDISFWELFWPILVGARSVVAPPGAHRETHRLAACAQEGGVTVIHFVPSMLDAFLDDAQACDQIDPRLVICSGEALSNSLRVRFFQRFPEARLYNLYGPTEAAIEVLSWECRPEDTFVPIGLPIANTHAYILDPQGLPCPQDVAGELHLGGIQLARGYQARPGLTASSFVPDPFDTKPGGRLYKTGDLVRWQEKGGQTVVAYLGRIDHQVKLRGFRIELGEIESVLGQLDGIGRAVVLLTPQKADQRLVAFLAPEENATLPEDDAALQAALSSHLPEYMVPSLFLRVTEIPVTVNGKIDRAALLQQLRVSLDELHASAEHQAPANDREAALAEIWRDLLDLDQAPSVRANFFDLGGHSLLVTRLVSRIRQQFSVELSIRDIFGAPTIQLLANHLLSEHDQGLAEPTARVRPDRIPLSFSQRRLWFLYRMEGAQPVYNMPAALQLDGELDAQALSEALDQVCQRHEILRTRFEEFDGEPYQIPGPPHAFALPLTDLSYLAPVDAAARAHELAREHARRPFHLESDDLLRVRLLKLQPTRHVLLVNMHHIISDGWSLKIMIGEVVAAYNALRDGVPLNLAPLPLQYADYALWQKECEAQLEEQLDWWRNELEDAPRVLDLPTRGTRPARQTFTGALFHFRLEHDLCAAIDKLAQTSGATRFQVLQAIFAELLGRYGRAQEVNLGVPVANRRFESLEPLIGFFVNTLVRRNRRNPTDRVRDRIDATRVAAIAADAHQDLPLERIIEAVKVPRDPSRSPLFQVMLAYQDQSLTELGLRHLKTTKWDVAQDTARFDITLSLREEAAGLEAELEYNVDLFTQAMMAQLAGHFQNLAWSFCRYPERGVADLDMMAASEREHLVCACNDTAREFATPRDLVTLIDQQALRRPDQTAIVFEDTSINYRSLREGSHQLAHWLRSRGVCRGVAVAVALERSLDLQMVLLAVIQAGGYYVPIDPATPHQRIRFMVEDANAALLLTHGSILPRLPELPWVAYDGETEAIRAQPTSALAAPSQDDAVYAIYTSGSTGKPKGVINSHGALVNRLVWMVHCLGLMPDDRMLHKTPYTFDVSVWELFCPLAAGVVSVVVPPGAHREPARLVEIMRQQQVSVAHFVPSMLAAFLDAEPAGIAPRMVVCSGEALPPALCDRFRQYFPETDLHNLYGPTEAAIEVTWWQCRREDRFVPIGKPIANTQVYVLDPHGFPLPQNVAGELHLGGVQLARCYLNRPGLTASSFVPDPYSSGMRLYKTGDLARWCEASDGSLVIEYLGRLDHQVKLRGFRIELGEIEATLNLGDRVTGAVVLVVDHHGDQRLVAFLTTSAEVEADALRTLLAQHLPEYMVPTHFLNLQNFPVTANGKVDRKALIQLHHETFDQLQPEHQGDAPANARESALAEIWSEVLGLAQAPGVTQSFFDLGGHSLLVTRLISRIRKTFDVDLSIHEVFSKPTIRQLATMLNRDAHRPQMPTPSAMQRPERLPASFAQTRLWFLYRLEGEQPVYNMPFAVRLQGPLDREALDAAFDHLVACHESVRTRFEEHDGDVFQLIEPHRGFAPDYNDLSDLSLADAEAKAAELAREHARWPFQLERGGLLRVLLLRLTSVQHLLLVNMHHIISDGSSLEVLIAQVEAAYNARHRGQSLPSESVGLQYPDYALWQRQALDAALLDDQLDWWRAQLEGAPHGLNLPTIGARPLNSTFVGRRLPFSLAADLTAQLQRLASSHQATLFQVMEAIFAEVLGRTASVTEVNIGIPTANRNFPEWESLIGFLVNTLVLRNDLSAEHNVGERIAATRELALGAFAHQEVPFEKLVEVLNPPREMGRSPLFQVMFAFQENARTGVHLDELDATTWTVDQGVSRFEITFSLRTEEGCLRGDFEYNTALFDAGMMSRMAGHVEALAEAFVANQLMPVYRLSMVTAAERALLLHTCNDTARDFQAPATLIDNIEQQVRRDPACVAVVFEDQTMTYGQLWQDSARLAHALRSRGVRRGMAVAVALQRSVDLQMVLLAVIRAGGYYVPIDPATPHERIRFMVEDANAASLLSHASLLPQLPELSWLAYETLCEVEVPTGSALPVLAGDDAVYAIYTSGSTGKPKGVINSHGALVNRLVWMERCLGLKPDDRMLHKTPYTFDVSVWELFCPLTAGVVSVVVPPGAHREPARLVEIMHRQQVSVAHFVPSMLAAFLDEEPSGIAPRMVVCSGEALPPALCDRFRQYFPETDLHNLYGPTEAAIEVTWWLCRRDDRFVPIGKPIANTQVYVLDPHGYPLPQNVAGELHLGGVQLARCYLNRPGLTASSFVPDPFSEGKRLYKTGDLARWCEASDGTLVIEYLGRLDHQVKLRGFRIELGEIEATLSLDDRVTGAVVLVVDHHGDQRLVAFLTTSDEVERDALRALLAQHLPEYMVPTYFLNLPSFPVTANGKVDRKALIQLHHETFDQLQPEQQGDAPANAQECALADIWTEVLGLTQAPGVTQSFFDLGGHSLLVTRLISRIRKAFAVDLSIREVFSKPTIRELAAMLNRDVLRPQMPPPGAMQRTERLPASFAQTRLWFLYRLEGEQPVYNMPFAMRLKGPLDRAALDGAFDHLVACHESVRTRFEEHDGDVFQVIEPHQGFAPDFEDLSNLSLADAEAKAVEIAGEHARWPFQLERGELLRVLLLRLTSDQYLLLVNMHHIISDGSSLEVLIGEVEAAYNALRQGKTLESESDRLHYADYALWQRQALDAALLEDQLDWWRTHMEGAPHGLNLPTIGPRPLNSSFVGRRLPFSLAADLTAQLQRLASSHQATLFQVMEAIFAEVLGRTASVAEVNIGIPTANRNFPEWERLIGFMVNTLVLRNVLSAEHNVGERIAATKELALGAFAHQEVPFEKLVEDLDPPREMGRSPLFQVMFAFQEHARDGVHLDALQATTWGVDQGTSRFEITCSLRTEAGCLLGELEYNTDLFDADMMGRMAGHVQVLAQAFVDHHEEPVCRLSMLTGSERDLLLRTCNATYKDFQAPASIVAIIEGQAQRSPDATAVIFEGTSMSFVELWDGSFRLAAMLRTLGVDRGVAVAVALERSLDLQMVLLAIMRAGGYYIPIDPTTPEQRLQFMVADARPGLLLSHSRLIPELPNLDWQAYDGLDEVAATHLPTLAGDDADYAIYTSGSTGKPKGVINTHASLVNRLLWMGEHLPLHADDRVLHKTPYTFDVSVWELFWPLMYGVPTVVAPPGAHREPARLAEVMAAEAVSVLHFVPSMLAAFLDDPAALDKIDPRLLICSGEALPLSLRDRFLNHFPEAELHNLYGPTEAAIDVTAWQCSLDDPFVPIGQPIANTRVYVYDRAGLAVPMMVAGELHLAGVQLARCYLDRPALTAQTFVPDPSGDGSRIYKTGDLVRWRLVGDQGPVLEYLGRIDHQVKLRGLRIELGEIEAALTDLPGVETGIVLLIDQAGDPRLVAFMTAVTPRDDRDLREGLIHRLPDYMIPAHFIQLDHLPVTANGKTDRRALIAHYQATVSQLHHGAEDVPPSEPREVQLAEIWAKVLGLSALPGVTRSFFELGGHSLLVMRVIAMIRESFEVELSVREFFATPSIRELAQVLKQGGNSPLLPAPSAQARPERLPASYAQQRLFFLYRLEGPRTVYNMPLALDLRGPLDREGLEVAFDLLVKRHESLRTRFAEIGGETVQLIDPVGEFQLVFTDLSDYSESDAEAEAARLARAHAGILFRLDEGRLFRAELVRMSSVHHLLLVNIHHVISDGLSLGLIVAEIERAYNLIQREGSAPFEALEIQYADYALWQRQHHSEEFLAGDLAWWRERLAGVPDSLDLPTRGARSVDIDFSGQRLRFAFDSELTIGLQQLARDSHATLFQVLQAAFAEVLGRYARSLDVNVGIPAANRHSAALEPLIGNLVNTLVLHNHREPGDSVRRRIARSRDCVMEANAHQNLPFEKLIEALNPSRDGGRSPLFQVMFTYQENGLQAPEFDGLEVLPFDTGQETARFEITLGMQRFADRLEAEFEYRTALFDDAMMTQLAEHFRNLCRAFVEQPNGTVALLPMLDQAERKQLLRLCHGEMVDYAKGPSIIALIEAQAYRAPDEVAIVFEGQATSRGQLWQRSGELACWLRQRGVARGTSVGVALERSSDLQMVLLAIIRAGGFYVPIDPETPAERLRFMVEDAHLGLLLTHTSLRADLPDLAWLSYDDHPWQSSTGSLSQMSASDAMYAIYTSGSTGKPKGVINSHEALVNRLLWMAEALCIDAKDRVLHKTPYTFDVSVWELFLPPLCGAVTVVAAPGTHREPLRLAQLMSDESVSVLHFVPSMLAAFLDEEKTHGVRPRLVVCSGEALPVPLRDRCLQAMPGVQLHNLYGPTEAAIDVTWWHCHSGEDFVPIGEPIANTRVYVLDPVGGMVPKGVAGELHLAGVQLARCYLDKPTLTANAFIPDPFSDGGRLYKTGDLVRWCAIEEDRVVLEYLGRIDHQVKLRGFRIELGEIEASLDQLPGITAAVVILSKGASGSEQLVAYLQGEAQDQADLRAVLADKLPEYMVPSHFMFLERFPVNANGKMDRAALPQPQLVEKVAGAEPTSPVGEIIAGIWSELLGTTINHTDANFFELGGHSLLATRVLSRIRETLDVEIALADLFANPKLGALTEKVQEARAAHRQCGLAAPTRVDWGGPVPLSFSQQGMWMTTLLADGANHHLNMPYTLRLRGKLDLGVLERCLAELEARHQALRTRIRVVDGEARQVVVTADAYAPTLVDLRDHADPEGYAHSCIDFDLGQSFDLAVNRPFRIVLYQLAGDHWLLSVIISHLAADGWSLGIWIRELDALYQAFLLGNVSPLEALPMDYSDYVYWQRHVLAGNELDRQLAFWKSHLAGAPDYLELPLDHPRPQIMSHRGSLFPFVIDAQIAARTHELARNQGVTVFVVLKAALAILLQRYSGQDDLVIGTNIANRPYRQMEGIMGLFTSILAMRCDLTMDPDFLALLERMQRAALDAYEHSDVPFDHVLDALDVPRGQNYSPLFQVMLVLQNLPEAQFHLPELELSLVPRELPTTKYDLTLFVNESDGEMRGCFEYSTDLFERHTITEMSTRFTYLLGELTNDPSKAISQYSIIQPDVSDLTSDFMDDFMDDFEED